MLNGIGVGPLIMRLLNLDTRSEVHNSSAIDEKQTNVGQTRAWFYYNSHIKKLLFKLVEKVPSKTCTVVLDNGTQVCLSSNKLVLLVISDSGEEVILTEETNWITRLGQITLDQAGAHIVSVYSFAHNDGEKIYMLQNAKQPLDVLEAMKMQYVKLIGTIKLNFFTKLYLLIYQINMNLG